MISLDEIMFIHHKSIERYGGSHGLRDESALKSAIERPYQTFDGQELYPDMFSKSAAIIESVLMNHPFVDGNKRTGFALMLIMLHNEQMTLHITKEQVYEFVVAIASGQMRFDDIEIFLRDNVTTL